MNDTFELSRLLAEQKEQGAPWLPFLKTESLEMGIYVVTAEDRETHRPHPRDEVYYAVSGRGVLRVEGEDHPVAAGSILFVAGNGEHYFHTIREALTLLVFFANGPHSPG